MRRFLTRVGRICSVRMCPILEYDCNAICIIVVFFFEKANERSAGSSEDAN